MVTTTESFRTVGRGKLYFDAFPAGNKIGPGTGELYLGNTPKVDMAMTNTALDHYDSDKGLKIKDDSITIETDLKIQFDSDEPNGDNLALWFLGARTTVTQAGSTAALAENIVMLPGRGYQLGKSDDNPVGLRNLASLTLMAGTAALVPGVDYVFDAPRGRALVLPDTEIVVANGSTVAASYHLGAGTNDQVIMQGAQIYGALRYIAENPVGPQDADIYFPFVKLTSSGTYPLKSDTWQMMSFECEALILNENVARAYIDLFSTLVES